MHVHRWAISTPEQASLFYPGLSKRQFQFSTHGSAILLRDSLSASMGQLAVPITVAPSPYRSQPGQMSTIVAP